MLLTESSLVTNLIAEMREKHSKKEIEDFFGIVIKKVYSDYYGRYNLYKDGKLVLAKIQESDIDHILEYVAVWMAGLMYLDAEKEDENTYEKTNEKFKEQETLIAEEGRQKELFSTIYKQRHTF